MRTLCHLFFLSSLLMACELNENTDYKKLNQDIRYKLHQFGEGEPIGNKQFLSLFLTIRDTLGDTLHYVPDYPYFLKRSPQNSLDSNLNQFRLGDSLSFILNRKTVNQKFKFYRLLQSNQGKVIMDFRLVDAFSTEKEMENAKYRLLSQREVEEQAALRKYLKNLKQPLDTLDGVYRLIEKKATGNTPEIKYGSQISLHYRGRFLNNYVFDDTYQKGVSPTFVYGQDYQLIEGMHNGLNGLKEGDSIKIIVPSRRGFGEEGSLAGIVPPYTAVIFEVNIKKVNN